MNVCLAASKSRITQCNANGYTEQLFSDPYCSYFYAQVSLYPNTCHSVVISGQFLGYFVYYPYGLGDEGEESNTPMSFGDVINIDESMIGQEAIVEITQWKKVWRKDITYYKKQPSNLHIILKNTF